MTREDAKKLRFGGLVTPSGVACVGSPSCCGVVRTGVFTPDVSRPMTDADYNKLSLSDIAFLHQFKGSDPLHRSDMILPERNRGARLREWFKEHGADKFNSNYQN